MSKEELVENEEKSLESRLEEEGDIAADYLEGLLDIADLDGDIEIGIENDRAHPRLQGGLGRSQFRFRYPRRDLRYRVTLLDSRLQYRPPPRGETQEISLRFQLALPCSFFLLFAPFEAFNPIYSFSSSFLVDFVGLLASLLHPLRLNHC